MEKKIKDFIVYTQVVSRTGNPNYQHKEKHYLFGIGSEVGEIVIDMVQSYNPINLGINTTKTKFYNYEKPNDLSWLDILELLEEGFCKIYTIGAYSIRGVQTEVDDYTELHFLQNYPDPFTIIVINHKHNEFRLKIDIQYLKAKCFDELIENIDNLPQR